MRSRAAIVACVLWLAPLPGLADETGYERDYDYPGQGDDWYGRGEPDANRDYAPTRIELMLSGDDFCLGHETAFDYFGYGPILERTNETDFEFLFRFTKVDSDLPCTGNIPACDDGDSCTNDYWGGASCQYVAPPVPGEIAGVALELDTPVTATLSWTADPAADWYDLYRASSSQLGDLACLVTSIAQPTADDDGQLPAAGQVFYMLVTGRSCSGESTPGRGRVINEPCQ